MPLRLDVKRQMQARSERVKCVDVHPKEPWILTALYSGHVCLWNFESETLEKTFEVADPPGTPVRCAKFISRKQWFVTGSDDMMIRVFNYNTMEKVKTWDGHGDYIRSLAVHPTSPYIFSASDDMSIKLWDWEKDFSNTMVFEGHTHYVMQIEINPKDPNTFATASLDRTVRVWGVTANLAHFTLEGHERGVNCVSYFGGGDRPFLISGGDDSLVKIWDYQAKACIATLEGHTSNVSAVLFHPRLPIILSGSEDGTIRIWHSTTFRLENTFNYGMERCWALGVHHESNKVAIGYDEGSIMLQLGQEEPVMSMDGSGNVVWVDNHEIIFSNVRSMGSSIDLQDGEALSLQHKGLGNCEIYPQTLKHSPNGRILCICGDGEYTIYMARKLRNVTFGNAIEFVWSQDSKIFATRESNSVVKIFQGNKEIKSFRPSFPMEGIFGGALLGIRSTTFIDFYDWQTCKIVRRILVCPRSIYWSENGAKVVIACEESFFILQYDPDIVQKFFDDDIETDEQGIDKAFERHQEFFEKVTTGQFAGDYCFIYTNAAGRLKYYVGDQPNQGEVVTMAHLDRPLFLLGYLMKENRVYLMDKYYSIVSYSLLVDMLAFQIDIVSGQPEKAREKLKKIPVEHHNKLARFLESQDLKEMALSVTTDPEHQFELAWQLGNLKYAREILTENDSEEKWKQLSDKALEKSDLELAEECAIRSKDVGLLLLLYTSKGDRQGLSKLVDLSREKGMYNIAFVSLFLLNRVKDCIDLLVETGRIPEAAFMARTYAPSETGRIVDLWRKDLLKVSPIIARSIASPTDPNQIGMFPDFALALQIEKSLKENFSSLISRPASSYLQHKDENQRDLIQDARNGIFPSIVVDPIPENASSPTSAQQSVESELPKSLKVYEEKELATPTADDDEKPAEVQSSVASQVVAPTTTTTKTVSEPNLSPTNSFGSNNDFDGDNDFDLDDDNVEPPTIDDLNKSLDDLESFEDELSKELDV
uniref:Coatomer subunit beta' n=2 Tax=Hirondellea gigas TaxID=1518452 RepID=A0A6A7G7K8_9CRUS